MPPSRPHTCTTDRPVDSSSAQTAFVGGIDNGRANWAGRSKDVCDWIMIMAVVEDGPLDNADRSDIGRDAIKGFNEPQLRGRRLSDKQALHGAEE